MSQDNLQAKIHDCFSKGANEKLKQTIFNALGQLRERTIEQLEAVLDSAQGKLRLKVLEVLMEDGGADLVPLFIRCITSERNLLYAKSAILLYRGFKHQEALPALLSVEDTIPPDLRSTYQRALGRLLSRFSEHFYMSEFRAGIGNRRRVRFAVDMMLRTPHDDYLPFLNEQILLNDFGFRAEGVRALQIIGDSSSTEQLLVMLNKLRPQRDLLEHLNEMLNAKDRSMPKWLERLVAHPRLNWSKDQLDLAAAQIRGGRVADLADQLLEEFQVGTDLRKKVLPYLRDLLVGKTPSNFDENRAQNALADTYMEMSDLLKNTGTAIGMIGMRDKDETLIDKLESALPLDFPNRDQVVIAALGGMRNENAVNQLVEYVNTAEDSAVLENSLEALASCQVEEIPRGVEKLVLDDQNGVLRLKAMRLLGQWNAGADQFQKALEHSSLAVRADGVRTIAEHKLDSGKPLLFDLLKSSQPDSVVQVTLEALRAFPGEETGKACRSYLLPPTSMSLRKTALQTLFESGGPERIDIILRVFHGNPGPSEELIPLLLDLLATSPDEVLTLLESYYEFWLRIFRETDDEDLRNKLITLIERLKFSEDLNAKFWAQGLRRSMDSLGLDKEGELYARLKRILDGWEERVRNAVKAEQRLKSLESMLEGVHRQQQSFGKAQALRKLVQNYKIDLVIDNPSGLRKLVGLVSACLDPETNDRDVVLQAIALAGKLRHPKVYKKLKLLEGDDNISIRNATKRALQAGIETAFIKPIKRIFVVDDSRYITKQLAKILAQNGFEVDFENSPLTGLEEMKKKDYDLLILDYVMPEMDGLVYLRSLNELDLTPDHVLIITSTRDGDELRRFQKAGVEGILLKPFRMEDMLKRIEELGAGA